MTITKIDAQKVHARQQEYVEQIKGEGFDFGLTVATAFVQSIRDLGYRSTGTALNELIDNAAEAGAENIHVCFGYPEKSKKPGAIAVLDDGIGMVAEMVRAAMVWGGTHRHGSRDLFGRYGYGLPSASVSQGKRFVVYSRIDDGPFNAVALDLEEIEQGKYIENGRVTVPVPAEAELPTFVSEYAAETFPGGVAALRTVVVWDKLDRVSYRQSDKLENLLLETFGITYRNILRSLTIVVNGKSIEPVDPLFLTEGARFYDLDEDRAMPDDPIIFDVRDQASREVLGTVRVRFSLLPPTFARSDKRKNTSRGNNNKRFPILRDHNGLIALRQGRQIDVVTKGAPTVFVNNDQYIGLEVDFPPTLDEEFGVTTHKQQITLSDRMWLLLEENGVWATFDQLRKRYRELLAESKSSYADPEETEAEARPSEMAMVDASRLDPTPPPSERRSKLAEDGRQAAIGDLVDMGVPKPEAERVVESIERERPFKVEIERIPEGPFYRVELRGGQLVLYVNKAHRFFTDIYAAVPGPEGARIRQALEVLLFVVGKCEIEASEERQLFYVSERQEWSKRLHTALTTLDRILGDESDEDEAEAVTSMEEAATAAG